MMDKHTTGRWEVIRTPGNSRPRIVGSVYPVAECEPAGGSDNANAARIVACVNACEGIADPASLRAQRDELLAACKLALDAITMDRKHPGYADALSAAIARAEDA